MKNLIAFFTPTSKNGRNQSIAMSTPQPFEFTTRQGTRVFRFSHKGKNGEQVYSKNYSVRVKHGSKLSVYINLGSDKREASKTADEVISFLAVNGNTVAEAKLRYDERHRHRTIRAEKTPPPQPEVLTVGKMIGYFLGVTSHLSPMTRRNNTQALRHLAAGILDLPKLGVSQTKKQREEWRAKVETFPMAEFTPQKIEEFRQRALSRCGNDHKQRGATSTTLNSYLRAARGVFAKKLLMHYTELELPGPLPFQEISPLTEPSHRYNSKINVPTLMELAVSTLYNTDKDAWIAFLLVFGAGMRREELDKIAWNEVDLTRASICIRTTEFFRPKAKNSEANIDLDASIAGYLKEYKESNDPRRFVLPGREVSGKLRCRKVFNSLMKWLRANGVNERTPLHTLRKEAGSLVFQQGGSIDLTAEFLRNDPRVAREHYIGRKERIELKLPGI